MTVPSTDCSRTVSRPFGGGAESARPAGGGCSSPGGEPVLPLRNRLRGTDLSDKGLKGTV